MRQSRTHVVSLMWGSAWSRYGHAFAESFERYWPESVGLTIVTDGPLPTQRAEQISLNDAPGYGRFMAEWGADPKARGLEPPRGRNLDANGRSWRFDAVMWAPQAFAPRAVMRELKDGDILVWLDADVETTAPVPEDWVDGLLGKADVACLQRGNTHSEIGFYALRVWARTRRMIERFAGFYETGSVFGLREWHSAHVWDRALEREPRLTVQNLTTGRSGPKGHVWPYTRLAECTEHKKGKLKAK